MKFCIVNIICLGYLIFPNPVQGQTSETDSLIPAENYDVQRIYDKQGNLIYYDSTHVENDLYQPKSEEYDSLINALKEDDRRVNYSIRFPKDSFSYSFRLPERFFDYAPDYRFDIEVPKFDSLLSGFDYYFSLSPTDSAEIVEDENPGIEFHGTVPKFDPNLDETIWEIERRMREFHDRIRKDYNDWEKDQNEEEEEQAIPREEEAPLPRQEKISEKRIDI